MSFEPRPEPTTPAVDTNAQTFKDVVSSKASLISYLQERLQAEIYTDDKNITIANIFLEMNTGSDVKRRFNVSVGQARCMIEENFSMATGIRAALIDGLAKAENTLYDCVFFMAFIQSSESIRDYNLVVPQNNKSATAMLKALNT
jgi:hypothetical protein